MFDVFIVWLPVTVAEQDETLLRVSRQELGDLVKAAMTRISARQRVVLALRLYENLSHTQIARTLGCSELSARVTFFHAKRVIQRELHRYGLDKAAFVAALIAFGVGTLSSKVPETASVAFGMNGATESALTGLWPIQIKLTFVLGLFVTLVSLIAI